MSENRGFKEYIKYALGEIALTIVGIILALQVHVWNENRIEKKELETISTNLAAEFKLNKQNLENTLSVLNNSIDSSNRIIELIGQDRSEINKHNIDSILSVAFRYDRFSPSQDVISVLISSNKLKLIKNDIMRKALYDWASAKENFSDRFDDLDNNTSKFFDYLTNHYPIKNLDYYSGKTNQSRSNLKTDKLKVFQDLVFENQLDNHIYHLQSYANSLKKTGKVISVLIEESYNNDSNN